MLRGFLPALAGAAALVVLWRWASPPSLPGDPWWYAAAWLTLLAGPPTAMLFSRPWPAGDSHLTFTHRGFTTATWAAHGAFLLLLAFETFLGNYKLWLGMVYLGGVSFRLAGLAQVLEAGLRHDGPAGWRTAWLAAALSASNGLLLLPWLRPELGADAPWLELGRYLLAAGMWGVGSGALLFAGSRLSGLTKRGLWLFFLALGLGPPPVLAVCWLPLSFTALWVAACLVAMLLAARWRKPGAPAQAPGPMPLYWLVRALMILWWGLGLALALAFAWWRPDAGRLVEEGVWLRAVMVGAFLVACLGLLAEYSLPLLRKADAEPLLKPNKVLGVLASALALATALLPLLLMRPETSPEAPLYILDQARAELLTKPVVLGPKRQRLEMTLPGWLSEVSRVVVVSYMEGGASLPEGQPVLQLTAVDQMDLPHFYALRAGVDTAERDLSRRGLAARARHAPARVASKVTRFTPRGEAYDSRHYFTGIYLGQSVERIKTVTLRYIQENTETGPTPTVTILRVFVY